MPKVRLLTSMASPINSYSPGDIIEVSKDEAERMIEKGLAEPADQIRTATAPMANVENTSKKIGKK